MAKVIARADIEKAAQAQGLLLLGVASLECGDDYLRFREWLSQGRHGSMGYLERHPECRKDPRTLLPGARSAIVLGLPYSLGDSIVASPPKAAQYARFSDYHRLLKKKGEAIIKPFVGETDAARICVDTAPILEKALAAKTSFGFIGKNTCYIHPKRGSFFLLAEILTSLEVPADEHVDLGGCGNCNRCQVACPTGALDTDYSIDARKCLAYWTIENRGPIPEEFWPWLALYYFGCDICQLVCPYNKNASKTSLQERKFPSLYEIATMSQKQYEKFFGGTPMTRAKREGLRRNALIAMTVTSDPLLSKAMTEARLDAPYPVRETLDQINGYLLLQKTKQTTLS